MGSLTLRKQQTKFSIFNEIVPLSYTDDGAIRFGDSIILKHDSTNGILACDPYERLVPGQDFFYVTGTTDTPIPRARNTFTIIRPPSNLKNIEDDENDPILKLGQPFCLSCNESLLVHPGSSILAPRLYLTSTKKNERMATRSSNRQLVYLSNTLNADSIWYLTKPSQGRRNGAEKFLAFGQPMKADLSVQITHRQTNMYLTLDFTQRFQTEFGIEMECFADRSSAVGKLGILISEHQGYSTPNTLSKPDAPTFSWHIVLSDTPDYKIESKHLPPEATIDTILNEIKNYLLSHGTDGFLNLRIYFQDLDLKNHIKGKFYIDDLKRSLISYGIPLDPIYYDSLINLLDKKKTGLIDWRSFLRLIRGPLSNYRLKVIEDTFRTIDLKLVDAVSFDTLAKAFKGDEDSFQHLLQTFKSKGEKMASIESFIDYYGDLSQAIDDDESFTSYLNSLW
eukprot:gene23577-30571_t